MSATLKCNTLLLKSLRTALLGACALPCGGLPSWLTSFGLRNAGKVDTLGYYYYYYFGWGASCGGFLPSWLKCHFSKGLPCPLCLKLPTSASPAAVQVVLILFLRKTYGSQEYCRTLHQRACSFSVPPSPESCRRCTSQDSGGIPVWSLLQPNTDNGVCTWYLAKRYLPGG